MTDCMKVSRLKEISSVTNKYRFSGYNLPTVKLDDGFEYYVVEPHPSLYNQPFIFQKPAFQIDIDGNMTDVFSVPMRKSNDPPPSPSPKIGI